MRSRIILAAGILANICSYADAQGLAVGPKDLDNDVAPEVSLPHPGFGGEAIPSRRTVSFRGNVPHPDDQRDTYSCVGWTIGYGLLSTLYDRRDRPFSPYYVYRWGLALRNLYNKPFDPKWGDQNEWDAEASMEFSDGFSAIVTQGCCPFGHPTVQIVPHHLDTGLDAMFIHFEDLSSGLISDALKFHTYFTPKKLDQDNIVKQIKQSLANGFNRKQPHPIPCGFNIHEGFRQGRGLDAVPGKAKDKPCLWSKDSSNGNKALHAMLIVGYDDDFAGKNKGAFEVMNSFGEDFADDGFVWISYDLMSLHGSDPEDRASNPCCVVVWDYDWSKPQGSFSYENQFKQGRQPGWVRLVDPAQTANFTKQGEAVASVDDLHKGDRLRPMAAVHVRNAYNAVLTRATTAGREISTLNPHNTVILEDYNVLRSGNTEEVWAKVRLGASGH